MAAREKRRKQWTVIKSQKGEWNDLENWENRKATDNLVYQLQYMWQYIYIYIYTYMAKSHSFQ